VKSQKGETGIDDVAHGLKKMMREELAERVEVAFDEEYMWPLGIAILLLIVEGCVPEAPLPKLGFGFVGGTAALRDAPGAKKTKKKKKKAAA
jgi:Ca-activated chloride channel family protein